MCRIFGYISEGNERFDQQIANVSTAQRHGGPDAQRFIAQAEYGIGANRLAITDPNGGNQPYDGLQNIYAVLNGEIYNHNELRRSLERDGYRFKDRCDGSIIPALYDKYGSAFPEYLDGMFTIAVLDLRNGKPELLLTTDTSGIKPVYFTYRTNTGSLAFATEVPGLLKFGIASGSVWQDGIDHFLTTRSVTRGRTILNDVYSLPPGSILRKKLGEAFQISSYKSRIIYDGPIPQSLKEAGNIFRELLAAEISKLSKADAEVCSINSGGLDSSLITSLMCKETGGANASFHVAMEGNWPFDERVYSRELAEKCGIAYHEAIVKPEEIPYLFEKMTRHLGLPNCAPHALSTYRLFEKVSQAGYRVALTGEGSDELFCGHARMGSAIRDTSLDWITNYLSQISPCTAETRQTIYSKGYSRRLEERNRLAITEISHFLCAKEVDRSVSVRKFEQDFSLPYYILHRVEPLAMASGVEVRVPFCQPRIMDFSWKINPELFLANGDRGKAVVYSAANNLVPRSILKRPKQPFTLPIIKMMHKDSPIMRYIQDIIGSRKFRDSEFFDRNGLDQLVKRQETAPSKETAFTLWAIANYAVWAEMIADIVKPSSEIIYAPKHKTVQAKEKQLHGVVSLPQISACQL